MVEGQLKGQIIEGRGGLYTAKAEDGSLYVLRAKGKFRKQGMVPLVGDMICLTPGQGDEHGWVEEILPRKSTSVRPPVANIDLILITIAASPPPDLLLVDKLLVRSRQQNIENILLYNKQELDTEMGTALAAQYEKSGAPFYLTSAARNEGLAEVKKAMEGKLCCMAGQSGVGKSTLLNALLGFTLETGEISKKIQRGKHTTRHAALLEKDGLRVLDTPGFSLLEFDRAMDPVALQDAYPDFATYRGQCRFSPCYHQSEPGCAVTAAARDGQLSKERLARYHQLLDELRQAWRERYG